MTQLSWRIVDRYFAGEATAAERALVERWLAESPLFRALVAELYRGTLDRDAARRASAEVHAHFERALTLIPPVESAETDSRGVRVVPMRRAGILQAAAAILILLGGPLLIWRTARIANTPYSDAMLRTVTAPAGQRATVRLPDGSHAILSPGSTIRYAVAGFRTVGREIHLDGEAYFAVDHDAQRPFVVRAGDLVVHDLGTQFIVRAYPEDRHAQVVVREGSVSIGGDVVVAGQLGRLSDHGRPMVEAADTASWFAWTQGPLRFAGVPLRDALPKLTRWYDLEFRLADSALGNIQLVGDFPERLDATTLQELAVALDLQATRNGRVVVLQAGPAIDAPSKTAR